MEDRAYVSRYAGQVFGLIVHRAGVPGDADGAVTVSFTNEDTNTLVFSRTADHVGPGEYSVTLTSADSSTPGFYGLEWSYLVNGGAEVFGQAVEVGSAAPAYDGLAAAMKDIVESVWIRFADLFDFEVGGPHLQAYVQTNFGRQRLGQLLKIAVGKLNTTAQPYQTYTIDGDGGASFPVAQWGSLLESALYVECLKHLVRSYTEQPDFQSGSGTTRLDRRDYMDRWKEVLDLEEPTLKSQLEVFKIANMGLGKARVLVSGGAYGRWGPQRMPMSAAARPRFSTRFYA